MLSVNGIKIGLYNTATTEIIQSVLSAVKQLCKEIYHKPSISSITKLEKENLIFLKKVTFLTRKLYGSQSEQISSLRIKGQMSLFDEAEMTATEDAPEPNLKRWHPIDGNGFRVRGKNY